MTESELTARKEKARRRRYAKALVKTLNRDTIYDVLNEILEAASSIQYLNDDEAEDFLEDVLGSEDQAFEFKMMFSDLSADAERMIEDLQEEMVWDNFDDIMVTVCPEKQTELLGYDTYEQDYFGLPGYYDNDLAKEESVKRLERLNKRDLIETMHLCFSVAFQFIGIKTRYEDLQSTLDIIRGKNHGFIEMLKEIDRLYEQAAQKNFRQWESETEAFDRLLNSIQPYDRVWIE